jgi:hypothetical protein
VHVERERGERKRKKQATKGGDGKYESNSSAATPPPDEEVGGDSPIEPSEYKSYVLLNNHKDVIEGAKIFARDCFVCHSSVKQPESFWASPADWKKWVTSENYVKEREEWLVKLLGQDVVVHKVGARKDMYRREDPFFEEFVKENYLSTDARYPVGEIGTNTARSLADNAGSNDRMWADYSSIEFKTQPHIETRVDLVHPYDKDKPPIRWSLHNDAGPGRYRPHSLSSMWAHAPYLHNNSVGYYPYEYVADPRPGQEGQVLSTLADGIQN